MGSLWAVLLGLLLAHSPASAQNPAVFRVTDEVVNENPGAFTATTGPKSILVDMNFEPMVMRERRTVVAEGTGRIYADKLDYYNSLAPGYWDGAKVRAFRVSDGRLDQVYSGEVLRHRQGQWHGVGGSRLIPAQVDGQAATEASFVFAPWEKPEQSWWLTLIAVDAAGRESPQATPVTLVNPRPSGDRASPANVFTLETDTLNAEATGEAPAAPIGLSASADPETGLITLSWDTPTNDGVAGYKVRRSYVDPAAHVSRPYLEVTPGSDGMPFTFRESDLIFLDLERRTFTKDWFSPRVYNAREARAPGFRPRHQADRWSEENSLPFELVDHDASIESVGVPHGSTAMRFQPEEAGLSRIMTYNHADTTQDWYRVLDPAKTYVVEFLAKQEGGVDPEAKFGLTGRLSGEVDLNFDLSENWSHHRAEFTVDTYLTESGHVGQMYLQFQGPGTVWIDAFRVYEKEGGLVRWDAADRAAFAESGMASIRTHDTVKSDGYSLDNLLGHPEMGLNSGTRVFSRGNLSAILREMAAMDVFPWLQIEFTLGEAEWRGLVEYLAAPYDPAVDTPESKPWAHRRYEHGQAEPYSQVFERMLFEFSNENWNRIMPFNLTGVEMTDAVTGETYGSGEVYGLLQEYTIGVMQSSPYWDGAMEARSEFVIGGWNSNNFGYQAARHSPSSEHVLVADYNGGWDAGEGPSDDLGSALTQALNYPGQASWPATVRFREDRDAFAQSSGMEVEIGTYEAGPGYNIDGLNGVSMTMEMVAFENQVMKSLAAGTATLDSFLNHATHGAKLQNFFTFSRNRNYWTSHAELRNGGQAYPSWMALSVYNNHGQGDFLNVLPEQVPTRVAEAVGRRSRMEAMPEVAVHATRQGDRLAVFVLSRKLEGTTPVRLELPITSAQTVTLHRLQGDPTANNLDAKNVAPETVPLPAGAFARSFALTPERGAAEGGLPAAATYLYVFEGVNFADAPSAASLVPAPGQAASADSLPLRFRAVFDAPMGALGEDAFELSGSAEPMRYTVRPVPGFYNQVFEVEVAEVLRDGEVRLALADGLTTPAGEAVAADPATMTLAFPEGTLFDLLTWDFWVEDASERDYSGGITLPPANRMPVLEPTELSDDGTGLFGGNIHYNYNGIGRWNREGTTDRPYVTFKIQPLSGRQLQIDAVETGLWYSYKKDAAEGDGRIAADLEVWVGDQRVETLPFIPDAPIPSTGLNLADGTRVVADTTSSSVLQEIDDSENVELRIVLSGLDGVPTTHGMGKIGREQAGIVVRGVLLDAPEPPAAERIEGASIKAFSANQAGNEPVNLLDGNPDDASRWSANGQPQWVLLDLGEAYELTESRLWTYQDRAYQYTIEGTNTPGNPGSYERIVDRRENAQSGQPMVDSMSGTYRYLRLRVTGVHAASTSWVALTEWAVRGVPSSLSVGEVSESGPFGGSAALIPSVIQAENYDLDGADTAFFDTDPVNSGGVYREDSVDLQATSDRDGGYNVGWIEAGEWLHYTAEVLVPGEYVLRARTASPRDSGAFRLLANGEVLGGAVTVPNTGGWQNWTSVDSDPFVMDAGDAGLRIEMLGGSWNLNWFELVLLQAYSAPSITAQPADATVYAGQDVFFEGMADGYPAPALSWQRESGGSWAAITGAASNRLEFPEAAPSDGGAYRLVATNRLGSAQSDSARLTVLEDVGLPGFNGEILGTSTVAVSRQLGDGAWEQSSEATGLGTLADAMLWDYVEQAGDFQARVRIRGLSGPTGALAGLMLREGDGADARMVSLAADPANRFQHRAREITGGAAAEGTLAVDGDGLPVTHAFPDKWLLIEREGDLVRLAVSGDDSTYNEVATYELAGLAPTLRVGLFSTGDDTGALTTAGFDTWTLVEDRGEIHSYSATQMGNEPPKLLDSDIGDSSRWSAPGMPQWVILDRGAAKPLNTSEIWTYQDRAYQYTLEGAESPAGPWTLLADRRANSSVGQPLTDALSGNFRYVRLTVSGVSGTSTSWVALTEWQVR